ncbi:MAG: hypothetical protein AAF517_01385 [Planctomycetota bacterium]
MKRLRPSPSTLVCLAAVLLVSSSCASRVRFRSNRDLLERIATDLGFELDSGSFEIFHAQVREDAILLYYRGVEFPGDRLWVWRFSKKSTEQKPEGLTDVESLVPIVADERAGFEAGEAREAKDMVGVLRTVAYTFLAPVRDHRSEPYRGRGILGTYEREVDAEPIIYYFNFDNWGDRATLEVPDLGPILEEMRSD